MDLNESRHGSGAPAGNLVEDLTDRMDQMNVGQLLEQHQRQQQSQLQQHQPQLQQYLGQNQCTQRERRMSVDEENIQPARCMSASYEDDHDDHDLNVDDHHYTHERPAALARNSSQDEETQILIVTRLDPRLFSDPQLKGRFEALVRQHDDQVTFRYFKSFRRVRLDFTSAKRAEQARAHLNNSQLGATSFRCYPAHFIRPNFGGAHTANQQHQEGGGGGGGGGPRVQNQRCFEPTSAAADHQQHQPGAGYLNIPKLTRQHLISPPMSPPVGWEPKEEATPSIDVQLLSAIANLVPGQTHEIHAATDSQPGIYVEVCEEPHFETISELSCRARQLPKTMIPGTPRPEPVSLVVSGDGGAGIGGARGPHDALGATAGSTSAPVHMMES